MDNLMLILTGFLIGVFFYDIYLKILKANFINKHYKKPLLDLVNRGMDIYTFSYRQGDYVVLMYDIKNFVYLDLKKRTVAVFKDKEFLFSNHDALSKEFDKFYINLLTKFHKQIYEDIIKVNNIVYSKNIFHPDIIATLETTYASPVESKENTFSIDNILDKINESGLDSLTEEEKNFLYKQTNKSEE